MIKKSQSAIEFIIIIGAVLFFFVSLLLVIQKNMEQKNLEKDTIIAQNIALSVQDELNLAEKASDGYYREFKISEYISGFSYELKLADNRVYVSTDKIGLSYPIIPINGDIKKGTNIIRKQNGTVYLNLPA